jgi:hypothetical protein
MRHRESRTEAGVLKAEANGHADTLAPAIDAVVNRVAGLDPAKAYDSPERLAEWDAETVLKVNESARECAAYRADHEAKAEVAKDAKKAYELAVADHFKLVDQRKAGRGQPVQQELFDRTRATRRPRRTCASPARSRPRPTTRGRPCRSRNWSSTTGCRRRSRSSWATPGSTRWAS